MKTLEEAARQALDYWESCGFGDAVMVDKMAALRTALAEQEPVGEVRWAADVPGTVKEVRWADDVAPPVGTHLYTAPQPAVPPGYKLVPVSLLEDLAPAEPVNDDETGGCVFCGGRPAGKPFGDASSDPSDHRPGCPWVKIRALLSGTAPQPAKQEPLTDEETVAQRDELLAAAKHVMEFIEVAHRPPVKDEFEFGRMVLVRLHALAHLHAAIAQVEGEIK